jgi:hypothetical protein
MSGEIIVSNIGVQFKNRVKIIGDKYKVPKGGVEPPWA